MTKVEGNRYGRQTIQQEDNHVSGMESLTENNSVDHLNEHTSEYKNLPENAYALLWSGKSNTK